MTGERMGEDFRGNSAAFYLMAVIATVCWGLAPVFAKVGLRNLSPMTGLAIRTGVTTILLTGWMLMDGSLFRLNQITMPAFFILGCEAILATLIGDWAYYSAVKRGPASLVTIIMACSPLVTITLSVLLLGEAVTIRRIIGVLLIIGGIVLAV
jgi:bacterial/archaeal transporter family protein